MKVIEPYFEILTPLDGVAILKHIESCGRVCYKSEHRVTENSHIAFAKSIIARGHEAVLEHFSFSVRFVCDRGVSHEIVRHRLASYCQESTRYCNYSNERFGKELSFIKPYFLKEGNAHYGYWESAMKSAELNYLNLIGEGCSPQEARTVLPNSLKTEIVMTANLREWRHFLKLRTSHAAHPQIREIAIPLLNELKARVPVIFDDMDA